MKIHIKSGGRSFTIPVPLSLALKFISKGRSDAEEKTEVEYEEEREQLKELARGLKEAKKTWGHLTLVEVYSADGDEVIITL